MEVTKVNIHKIENRNSFIGYADIVLDDALILKGLKIIKGKDGACKAVAPYRKPTKKDIENNVKVQVFHPLNTDLRLKIENAIQEALEK